MDGAVVKTDHEEFFEVCVAIPLCLDVLSVHHCVADLYKVLGFGDWELSHS